MLQPTTPSSPTRRARTGNPADEIPAGHADITITQQVNPITTISVPPGDGNPDYFGATSGSITRATVAHDIQQIRGLPDDERATRFAMLVAALAKPRAGFGLEHLLDLAAENIQWFRKDAPSGLEATLMAKLLSAVEGLGPGQRAGCFQKLMNLCLGGEPYPDTLTQLGARISWLEGAQKPAQTVQRWLEQVQSLPISANARCEMLRSVVEDNGALPPFALRLVDAYGLAKGRLRQAERSSERDTHFRSPPTRNADAQTQALYLHEVTKPFSAEENMPFAGTGPGSMVSRQFGLDFTRGDHYTIAAEQYVGQGVEKGAAALLALCGGDETQAFRVSQFANQRSVAALANLLFDGRFSMGDGQPPGLPASQAVPSFEIAAQPDGTVQVRVSIDHPGISNLLTPKGMYLTAPDDSAARFQLEILVGPGPAYPVSTGPIAYSAQIRANRQSWRSPLLAVPPKS